MHFNILRHSGLEIWQWVWVLVTIAKQEQKVVSFNQSDSGWKEGISFDGVCIGLYVKWIRTLQFWESVQKLNKSKNATVHIFIFLFF